MPRLVGAQNPHRKVPVGAEEHGGRAPSMPAAAWPARAGFRPAAPRSKPAAALPRPRSGERKGRKGLVLTLNTEKGNKPFPAFRHTKAARNDPLGDRKSRLARRLRGSGVSAAEAMCAAECSRRALGQDVWELGCMC